MTSDTTVALVTRNGARYLPDLLSAIRGQTIAPREILAVDSGSSDGTFALLRQAGVAVTEIAPWDFGHGRTRNLTARHDGTLMVDTCEQRYRINVNFHHDPVGYFEDIHNTLPTAAAPATEPDRGGDLDHSVAPAIQGRATVRGYRRLVAMGARSAEVFFGRPRPRRSQMLGGWLTGYLRRWLELDADRARVLEVESRLDRLAAGHELLARDAAAHLAALQLEWERDRQRLATLSDSQQTLLAQHEALRAAFTALEAAVADLEQAQTSVAVRLAGTPHDTQ